MEALKECIKEESKSSEYLKAPVITENRISGFLSQGSYWSSVQSYVKEEDSWILDETEIESSKNQLKSGVDLIISSDSEELIPVFFKRSFNSPNLLLYDTIDQLKKHLLKSYDLAVEQAKWMLSLEEGWDDMEAVVIKQELFNRATAGIREYINVIYKASAKVIETPQINPVPDGSIDFQWSLSNVRLLINVKDTKDGVIAYYYGDVDKKDLAIKGHVPMDVSYEHLSKWMEYLLKG